MKKNNESAELMRMMSMIQSIIDERDEAIEIINTIKVNLMVRYGDGEKAVRNILFDVDRPKSVVDTLTKVLDYFEKFSLKEFDDVSSVSEDKFDFVKAVKYLTLGYPITNPKWDQGTYIYFTSHASQSAINICSKGNTVGWNPTILDYLDSSWTVFSGLEGVIYESGPRRASSDLD